MTVRTAIEVGDVDALRSLLRDSPHLANELVIWGDRDHLNTHPLHFVCDKLFDKTTPQDFGVALVDALLAAGANVNDRGEKREPPLHGAASLDAEDVGLRFVDAGADPRAIGMLGETALHWASSLALVRLAARLIEMGAELNLRDRQYNATPLGWAIHGRDHWPPASTGRHEGVIRLLLNAGAQPY